MKFVLESITKEGGRCGLIKEIGRHANLAIETPACLMYTRAGAVPHLTWDLVEDINHRPQCVQLTCATLVDQRDALAQYGKGITKFASMPENTVIYASVQDPAHPSRTGFNDKHSVSVFTSAGRTKIDVGLFISLQEAVQPDWFEALCDGDTPAGSSLKRTKKAVDRTLTLLDTCIETQKKSEKLCESDILGVIEGGEILDERRRSAKETALRPVAGFVLDALADQQLERKTWFELIETVLKELPDCKPRLLPGVGKPSDVLKAVEAGIDVFDSSYPYQVTQRGCALVFPCETPTSDTATSVESSKAKYPQATVESSRTDTTQQGNVASDGEGEKANIDSRFELDLSEKKFAEDFSPVFEGCSCYCCTHHTKAYINHLLTVNELLARVLLMNHNCHHYFKFFNSIRTSLRDGTFHKLKDAVDGR